jgi:hypothetical protein
LEQSLVVETIFLNHIFFVIFGIDFCSLSEIF